MAPCINCLPQNWNISNVIPGIFRGAWALPKRTKVSSRRDPGGAKRIPKRLPKEHPKHINRILGGSHILHSGMAQWPIGMTQVWRTPVPVMLQPNMTTWIGFYTRNITFTKEITTLWPQMHENTMVFWNSNIASRSFTKEIATSWSQRCVITKVLRALQIGNFNSVKGISNSRFKNNSFYKGSGSEISVLPRKS